jgi:diguanylate cyclase (GGDEF)-like protein
MINPELLFLSLILISVFAYYIFQFMKLLGIFFLFLIFSFIIVLMGRGNENIIIMMLIYIINSCVLLILSRKNNKFVISENLKNEELDEQRNFLLRDINDRLDYNKKAEIRLVRYEKLKNVVSRLNADYIIDQALKILIDIFKQVIGKGIGYIILKEDNRFTIKRYFPAENFDLKDVDFDFEHGIFNWIQNNKNSVIINNISEDYRFKVLDGIKGIVSCICAPLISGDSVIGYFKCDSADENYFNYDDLNILNIICDVASNVISNALMFTKVKEMATVDNLTGLYLRRFFLERISEEMDKAREDDIPLSLLMVDIDHFKKINDTEGHLAGDKVLSEIANLFKLSTREMDILARYGGEEFTILLPHTDIENAQILADRLRAGVEKLYIEYMGTVIKVTISIGVATISKDIYTADELINASDKALYKAKESGRNKVIIYH